MAGVYYLYPTGVAFENESSAYSSAGTGSLNDTYGSFDDVAGYWARTDAGTGVAKRFLHNLTDFLPTTSGIIGITVGFRIHNKNGGYWNGQHIVRVGGANYIFGATGGSTGGVYQNVEHDWLTNPATSAAWTVSDLNALIAGCSVASRGGTKEYRITAIYVRVNYNGLPALMPQARDVASRRIFDLGTSKPMLSLTVPLHIGLDVDILDDIAVEHFAGPHDSANGWGPKVWEPRLMKVYAIEIDPMTNTVRIQARDRRNALALMHDGAWSLSSSSPEAIGIARFDRGCTRTNVRTGDTFVLAPGSLRITKVLENDEKYGPVGQLHERGNIRNELIESGFKNGATNTYTGWTQTPSGTGASFLDDLDDLIFEPISSGVLRSVKITHGSPLGVNSHRLNATATASFAASTKLRFSGWHKDYTPSIGAWWRLVRNIDTFEWNETTGTWVTGAGGAIWNQTPYSADWARVESREINVGAGGATTISAFLGGGGTSSPSPATAGQVNNWGHVQLERYVTAPTTSGTWPSSEILTESVVVTRNASTLTLSNNAAARCWNNAQGAFVCEVIPNWNTSDIGVEDKIIASLMYDANNGEFLFYEAATGRVVYQRQVAGVTYDAFLAVTFVRDQLYRIGARWCGVEAELDLPAYTTSVFVDGVKGTNASPGGKPTEAASSNLEIGSQAGGFEQFEGVIRQIYSLQYVPTDLEMARLPA